MKRDDMVLPLEAEPAPKRERDFVREGMNHYYNRDPMALEGLLRKLTKAAKERSDDQS